MQLDLWQQKARHAAARPTRRSKPTQDGSLEVCRAPSLERAHAEAERLVANAHTKGTRRAYQANWDAFSLWCTRHGLCPLPATVDTLCDYLAHLKLVGHKYSTIQAKKTAIGLAHAHAGLVRPDLDVRVRTLELSIAKEIGTREIGADPVLADHMLELVRTLDHSPRGDRDRAIFTLCFAGGFRSAELVALERAHLTFTDHGLSVLVARSKEDQRGRGRTTDIPFGEHAETCPVRALTRWLERVGDEAAPVFREIRGNTVTGHRMSARAISRAVQRAAEAVGLRSTERGFSSHSFRKGLITSATARGRSLGEIAEHCRCKEQSLARYILRHCAPPSRSVVSGML